MDKMITGDDVMDTADLPTISEDSLMSLEKLDRASPDLWPENSISKFVAQNLSQIESPTLPVKLTGDDSNQVYHFGNMTMDQIILEVKKLHDTAYKLGVEEAKEMTRGKYLNIFKQD